MGEQQRAGRIRHLNLDDLNRDFARERPASPPPPQRDWGIARGILSATAWELIVAASIVYFAPTRHLLAGILFWSGAALLLAGEWLRRRE